MDEQARQMDSQLTGWPDPVARLRQAIEKNEFVLYCQPIVALSGATNYAMGEVLVRMREEEKALLPPGEFLPVLEHFRMMPQLDRWVVRNTVKRLATGSLIPRFTVNLSGQTLEDAEFVRFVAAQLTSNGVRSDRLAFEIDENDTLARPQAALQFAAGYQALGGMVLIDGFGRRSVSFATVKVLGAKFLKVDGSITRRMMSSESALAKMKAMLRVGESLGFGVIAECVEDQDVLVRLKALGVGYAQGFGIHEPHPIDSFASTAP